MSKPNRSGKAYTVFMLILVILLIGSVALFVYASANNSVREPRLPGHSVFAQAADHG